MQLTNAIKELSNVMRAQAIPDRLWSVDDIAVYTGFSTKTVRELKSRPGFPRPIVFSKQERWIMQEVKDWAKKQRG